MKYPAVYMMEPGAHGEILSIAFAGKGQHQDAGGKVVHCAPNTTSKIISKSISKDGGRAGYRGLVRVQKGAVDSRSTVNCDALILDEASRSDTYPYMEILEDQVTIGHEATVSKIGDEQLFYLQSRGIGKEEAAAMIVSGFIEPIVKELPMEYAVEIEPAHPPRWRARSDDDQPGPRPGGHRTRRARAKRAAEAREPEWVQERRRAAAGAMSALAFPSHTDELWRRTDFRTAQNAIPELNAFASSARARSFDDLPAGILERFARETVGQLGIVVQRDADVVLEQTHPELERQGVVLCSLERAFREHGDKLKPLYGSLIHDDYDWYAAFGAAMRSGGAFVWVPDGVEAAIPIRLFQWIEGAGRVVAPRTVIALGRGARATIVEEQLSAPGDGLSVHVGGTEVFVGEDARLVYGTLQDWGRDVWPTRISGRVWPAAASAVDPDAARRPHGEDEFLFRSRRPGRPGVRARLHVRGRPPALPSAHTAAAPERSHHERPADQVLPQGQGAERVPGADPGERRRPAHRRVSGEPQPAALRHRAGRQHSRARDPRQRRALHARRDDRPRRSGADALSAHAGLPRLDAQRLINRRLLHAGSGSHSARDQSASVARRDRAHDRVTMNIAATGGATAASRAAIRSNGRARSIPDPARHRFQPLIYLDSAATSQKPEAVLAAMDATTGTCNANIHRGVYRIAEATALYEDAPPGRGVINASSPRELVFTRNSTEITSWPTRGAARRPPGRRIVLTEMEHHSNLVPGTRWRPERGVELRSFP
jgi:Fe-S cluster assembly scaffold protein SufB